MCKQKWQLLNMQTYPTLFKRTSSGKTQEWTISVHDNDDGTAVIVVVHGLTDGQMQTERETIREGKNAGKKNATTPQEQARAEARAKWNKKRDRDRYGLTVEESEAKLALAPMLAHKFEDHENKVDWESRVFVQPKFDGHRCLAFADAHKNIKLFSRKGVEIDTCEHIQEQLEKIMAPHSILDGELYIHGEPLNKIASYIRRKQANSRNLQYIIYDQVAKEEFNDRFYESEMVQSIQGVNFVNISRTKIITSMDEAYEFQQSAIVNGYEGAMLRHGDEGYNSGNRSQSLLKMKTFVDDEFKIVDAKEGRGKFEGMAIFMCETKDGNRFEVMSPGTHEEKRAAWLRRELLIGKMLTVKYQNYSATENPVPIFPVAKIIHE